MIDPSERETIRQLRRAEHAEAMGLAPMRTARATIVKNETNMSKMEQELMLPASVLKSMALTTESDPWTKVQFTNKFNSLAPTYDPTSLCIISYQNNTLRQCVAAMVANIDGTGYEIKRKDGVEIEQVPAPNQPAPVKQPLQKDDPKKAAPPAKPAPGAKASAMGDSGKPDLTAGDSNGSNPADTAMTDPPDVARIKAFFNEPYPGISFLTMRKKLRDDLETTGNAYLEVIRDQSGKIALLNPMDAKLTRMIRQDDTPVPVTHEINRTGDPESVQKVTILVHERRYVQIVGMSFRFFKQYKASRNLHATTGMWEGVEGKQPDGTVVKAIAQIPPDQQATEVIHFTADKDVLTPYGVPRWISQMPSVMGSRKAEELNMEFFDHGGIPPAIIMIQGGTLSNISRTALTSYLSGAAKLKQRAVVLEIAASGGDLNSAGAVKVTTEKFGDSGSKDSKFEAYDDKCTQRVRGAFRLPPLLIGLAQDYTYATSQTAYMIAEQQVFKPERAQFDEVINSTVMKEVDPSGVYVYESKPMTAKFMDEQLQGLELAKDITDGHNFIEELNEVTGLDLVFDQKAADLSSGKLQMQQDQKNLEKGIMPAAAGMGVAGKGGAGAAGANQPPAPAGMPAFGLKKPVAKGDSSERMVVDVTDDGRISKLDHSLMADLASDWAAMLTGDKTFMADHVESMHKLVKSMTPTLQALFRENVSMRVLGPQHDPDGATELLSCAGDVMARLTKAEE